MTTLYAEYTGKSCWELDFDLTTAHDWYVEDDVLYVQMSPAVDWKTICPNRSVKGDEKYTKKPRRYLSFDELEIRSPRCRFYSARTFVAQYFEDGDEDKVVGETRFDIDFDLEDVFAWFVRWQNFYYMPSQSEKWKIIPARERVNSNEDWLIEPCRTFFEDDPESEEHECTAIDFSNYSYSRADKDYIARTMDEADKIHRGHVKSSLC
jgi:hypothetical protein